MSLADRLRSTFLRIDARSLGLFRIAMGAALIGDWVQRWTHLRAFYSNEGVLPNHAHLFNVLKQEQPRVWSVLHAFSTPGESGFGLLLILLVYFLFLIGYKTRVFHVLSVLSLVSLTARNLLLSAPANDVAITLLTATAFLPCGSRFSFDSLRASLRAKDEKDATSLNDRTPPTEEALSADRSPGWSPTSLAALAVLLHVTLILVATARLQSGGQWRDGTALHYALWVERWVSDLGMVVRGAPPALLRAWTMILRVTPLAVPVLLFVPVPRYSRPIAFGLLVFYGFTYGLLFSFGLWGWTFVAAAFLMISRESWEAWQSRVARGRVLTVIYDADCGICLWLTRLLKRLDLRSRVTFQGNDLLTVPPGQKPPYRSPPDAEPPRVLYRRSAPGEAVESVPLPAEVTDELVTGTVVAVDAAGRVHTEGRAVIAVVRAMPLGALLSLPLRIPGTGWLWDALYRKVPPRRHAISEALGMGVCGVPVAAPGVPFADATKPGEIAPAVRLQRLFTGGLREAGSVLLLVAVLVQTGKQSGWRETAGIPQTKLLAAITGWTRMRANYDVIAPEAPTEDGVLVVDAQTRAGRAVDPLTGREPNLETPSFRLGFLWATYASSVFARKDTSDFEKPFRDYLLKGGRAWSVDASDNQLAGFDVYWLRYRSPAPGSRGMEVTGKDTLYTFQRGGRQNNGLPTLKNMNVR